MRVFFGWKFFNFILIPKNFEIPKISEVEIMLLSLIKQLNYDKSINNIVKLIINKFSTSNKFIILDNPQIIFSMYNNYLNSFDEKYAKYIETNYNKSFRTDLLNDITLVISDNLDINSLSKYSDYLHKISEITNKKYNITKISTLKIEDSPMLPIKFENILYIPYFYYSIKESNFTFYNISVKRKTAYKDYILLDLSIDDDLPTYITSILNLKNRISTNILCGGWINYDRTIQFIDAISNINLLNTFIIESSYNKLETYECVKILYLNAPPLVKPSSKIILEFKEFNTDKRNIEEITTDFYDTYNNLKIRTRNEFLKCNYNIDNKLKIKLDNKINLKKYFNDKSILPLTFNIGKIENLLSVCEKKEIFYNIEHTDYVTALVKKIIKFLSNFCKLNKNKYFIIKDAEGTSGINISGFNCFDDNYDKVNYEYKIYFLRNLFYHEYNTYLDKSSIKEHKINYMKCLKKKLVIQEFIKSPKAYFWGKFYNFKSRIFIIINQQKSQNDNISQLYSYLYKKFSTDLMEYKEVNPDNFFNRDIKTYDSFISNKNTHLTNLSSTEFIEDYVPDEKVKEFINKFNIYINKINKFVNGIFIDDNNNFINSNIYKILVIDVIFDINDNNNIKIIEINTEGAVYVDGLYENIIELIYKNNDSSFIKADSTFNYDEEVTYSEDLDDVYCINKFNETKDSSLKFKNKYLKYKNKYLKYKNNL